MTVKPFHDSWNLRQIPKRSILGSGCGRTREGTGASLPPGPSSTVRTLGLRPRRAQGPLNQQARCRRGLNGPTAFRLMLKENGRLGCTRSPWKREWEAAADGRFPGQAPDHGHSVKRGAGQAAMFSQYRQATVKPVMQVRQRSPRRSPKCTPCKHTRREAEQPGQGKE